MSSSTSSSDGSAWTRLAVGVAGLGVAAFALVAVLGAAVDPYDTGRLALVQVRGVPEQQQRMANASRARDPAFDSAVIGNSHTQLLKPEELNRATGAAFVSLATPGTFPREQEALLRYFVASRPTPPRVVVLGTDMHWCAPAFAASPTVPFPYWLYGESTLAYLQGLIGWSLLDVVPRRLGYMVGLEPRARPDGYWDYAEFLVRTHARTGNRVDLAQRQPQMPANPGRRFEALDALERILAGLPAETAVVLLRPPVYATALPEPGSEAEGVARDCGAGLARIAAGRPRTALVDWFADRPETRDPANFFDHTHYGQAVARLVEADIAAALKPFGAAAR